MNQYIPQGNWAPFGMAPQPGAGSWRGTPQAQNLLSGGPSLDLATQQYMAQFPTPASTNALLAQANPPPPSNPPSIPPTANTGSSAAIQQMLDRWRNTPGGWWQNLANSPYLASGFKPSP